jgi:transcriptional regulator with XRE-family HTH domain
MTNSRSPSVDRRILASELRRLRGLAGLTQAQAEQAAGLGETSLSRYENATSSMNMASAEKLLRVYGVDDERLAQLLEVVRASRRRGGLTGVRGVVPTWLEDLVALERDASTVQELAIRVVPGYLQTEDYARAVLSAGLIGADVERHVRARMERARLLDRPEPPEYWLVIAESALQVQVGGPEVMRKQLERIVEIAQRPNVTIQVLPDSHGAHVCMHTAFIVLSFAIAPEFSVVYMDYPTGSLYRDEPAEVEHYHRAYRHLIKAALPDAQSLELIEQRARDLS